MIIQFIDFFIHILILTAGDQSERRFHKGLGEPEDHLLSNNSMRSRMVLEKSSHAIKIAGSVGVHAAWTRIRSDVSEQ